MRPVPPAPYRAARPTGRTRRRALRATLALVLAAAFAALTVAPAQAASYRFWGFFQLTDATWGFAQKGSDQTVPADGTVEGWRFAVADANSSRMPRATPTFEQICAATPPRAGSKRVGLVIDFGRPADSADNATPPAATAVCAVVPTKATSTDVLRQAGELRIEKGLVCAVAGYPASDCGGEVGQVSDAAKAPDQPVELALPSASTAPTTSAPATESSPPAAPSASKSSAVAPSPTASAAAQTSTDSGSNVGTTIAYVVAALALIALIGFLLMRSRSAARSGDG